MRSIWKGAISFGLVTIPVKLYSATEQKDVAFHQVHREDGGRIRYRRVCTKDGEEIPYSDIAKGFELPSGEMVVLTDEDFESVPISTSRRIDVLLFAPMEQVDPINFNKSYYLEPEAQGTKPYVLLRDALESSGKVAIVNVRDGVFVLETMLWPDEIREADFKFLEEDVDLRPQELKMASSLIESMEGDFDPTEYKDAYREAVQEIIDAKVEGKEIVAQEPEEEAPAASDLLSALRASVEAAKKSRSGGSGGSSGSGEDDKPKKTGTTKAKPRSGGRRKSA
jgi:DNA end-binding protein Ku